MVTEPTSRKRKYSEDDHPDETGYPHVRSMFIGQLLLCYPDTSNKNLSSIYPNKRSRTPTSDTDEVSNHSSPMYERRSIILKYLKKVRTPPADESALEPQPTSSALVHSSAVSVELGLSNINPLTVLIDI